MEPLPYKNLAAYKFVELGSLRDRRESLRATGKRLGLKGTVLLSTEGINFTLSGKTAAVDEFVRELKAESEFSDLQIKSSPSHSHSFNRWLVKLKKEIIAFGVPGIEPERYTSARVDPATLKAWLDTGKKVHLLDVRNDYEIAEGTFAGALPIRLDHFRDFPQAIDALPREMRDEPVVTFCTGGVRCEKAAPLLESLGFKEVYQLDGGILQYFEDVGEAHYEGDCFVFDKRVALTPKLAPANKTLCFACQEVLSAQDLEAPTYEEGKSCPNCYRQDLQASDETLREREARCRAVATPLPGSVPYVNQRPIRVTGKASGQTVLEFLRGLGADSYTDWVRALEEGRILRREIEVLADDVVWGGDRLIHEQPDHTEPDVATDVRWLFEDRHLIAVNKPAPLPVHPSGRFNRNTLSYLLAEVYGERIRPAHRLDAATSGVQIFGRTARSARRLHEQFAAGGAKKLYLARIHGHPPDDEFECEARVSREPVGGIRIVDPGGHSARTEFTVLRKLSDDTALIEARPITGRTNQIRLHLWHLGWPIVGDPIYQRSQQVSKTAAQTGDNTMCLHAHRLDLAHPVSSEALSFEAEAPVWAPLEGS